jgi:hypothetical protein
MILNLVDGVALTATTVSVLKQTAVGEGVA